MVTAVTNDLTSRLPIARLLVIGMLVPLSMASVNRSLLRLLEQHPHDTPLLLGTLATLVVQIGLVGWLCGRWLEDQRWVWGLYAWSWLLIDLHVLTAAGHVGQAWHTRLIPHSLFAAQVGLALVWAVLGTTPWMIRLPACLVVGILAAWPLQTSHGFDRALVPPQVIALAAVCLVLRACRFRIEQVIDRDGAELTQCSASDRPSYRQFGIRHVLYWTTALAASLSVLRALDMLSLAGLGYFRPPPHSSTFDLLTAGLLIAGVFVVAVWAALGSGPLWQRIDLLAITLPTAGLALAFFNYRDNIWRFRRAPTTSFWSSFLTDNIWCVYWVILAGSLLFASLIILRVLGYRLVRRAPPRPVAGVNGG